MPNLLSLFRITAAPFLLLAGIILFLGFGNVHLFHFAVYFLIIEMIENIAITFILPKPMMNVNSVWHALRKREECN